MACECRNEDNTLSNKCFGTCKPYVMVEEDMELILDPDDPMNELAKIVRDFEEGFLQDFINKINERIMADERNRKPCRTKRNTG